MAHDLELGYTIKVDTSQAKPELEAVDQGFKDVAKSADVADASITKVGKDSGSVREQFKDLTDSLSAMKQQAGQLKTSLDQQSASLLQGGGAADVLTRSLTSFIATAALSGAAIGGAIVSTVSWASKITDASARVGASIEGLQALNVVLQKSGISFDQTTNLLAKMSQKLAGGDKNVVSDLAELRLELGTLQSMAPDQAFIKIAEAIAGVENPMERSRLAFQLFGLQGSQALKGITQDLGTLVEKAKDSGLVISEQTVKAIDDLGDSWTTLKTAGLALIANVLQPMLPLLNALAAAAVSWTANLSEAVQKAPGFVADMWAAMKDLPNVIGYFNSGASAYGVNYPGGPGNLPPSPPGSGGPGEPGPMFGPTEEELFGPGGRAAFLEAQKRALQASRDAARAQEQAEKERERYFNKAYMDILKFEAGDGMHTDNPAHWWGQDVKGFTAGMLDPQTNAILSFNALMQGQGLGARPAERGTPWGLPINLDAEMNREQKQLGHPLFGGFGTSVATGLPSVFLRTAEGGGNKTEATGSFLGQSFGQSIVSHFKLGTPDADEGTFGASMFGKILGGAIPILGSLLGPLLGKLFGPSKGKIEGMKADSEIADLQKGLTDTYGSLQNVDALGKLVGVDIGAAWGDKNVAGLKHFKQAVDDFNGALAETNHRFQLVIANGGVATDQMLATLSAEAKAGGQTGDQARQMIGQFLTSNVDSATAGLGKVADSGMKFTAGGAEAVGAGTLALIGQMQSMGMSMDQILTALGPTIQSLQKQFKALGVSGGTAFADLNAQVAFLSDDTVKKTVEGIDGLTQLMVGLGNTGNLTKEEFEGLTGQIGASYNKLIAQGKDGGRALRALQPDLQKMWELEQKFGFKADDATQKLIDQAVQSGIVGKDFESDTDKMKTAIDKLIEKFGLLIDKILGIVPASQTAAGAINNIPPPPGTGTGTDPQGPQGHGGTPPPSGLPHVGPRPPDYPAGQPWPPPGTQLERGGYITPYGVQHFALGGFVNDWNSSERALSGESFSMWKPQGTDTVPAMLSPGELVVPAPVIKAAGGPSVVMDRLRFSPFAGTGGSFTSGGHSGSQVGYHPAPLKPGSLTSGKSGGSNQSGVGFTINVNVAGSVISEGDLPGHVLNGLNAAKNRGKFQSLVRAVQR